MKEITDLSDYANPFYLPEESVEVITDWGELQAVYSIRKLGDDLVLKDINSYDPDVSEWGIFEFYWFV